MVQVHHGEGVANHIGPEPCAGIREEVGEASVGERAGQPLSRESAYIPGADSIHDLKHTFGRRLRAAQVPFETRQVLLGHKNGSITTHYSATEIGELVEGVNRIDASRSTPALTTLRAASVLTVA